MTMKEKEGTLRASHRTAPQRIQQACPLFFAALQTRPFNGVPPAEKIDSLPNRSRERKRPSLPFASSPRDPMLFNGALSSLQPHFHSTPNRFTTGIRPV
jgi:hypothetical protein